MRLFQSLFGFALFLISITAFAEDQVLFSIDFIRHGDRTPTSDNAIPKYPFDWVGFNEGKKLGTLTQKGAQQEKALGEKRRKALIEQENALISTKYNGKQVHIISTDTKRTIQSAQEFLKGLFPSDSNIHIWAGEGTEYLKGKCLPENYSQCVETLKTIWNSLTPSLATKLERWRTLTGNSLECAQNMETLGDTLKIRKIYNIVPPLGLSEDEADEIIGLGDQILVKQYRTKPYWEGTGTAAIQVINRYFDDRLESNPNSQLRYVLISGHDTTLLSILGALGVRTAQRPEYASYLNFSLKVGTSETYVEVTYHNGRNDEPLNIPKCNGTNKCNWETFQDILNNEATASPGFVLPAPLPASPQESP